MKTKQAFNPYLPSWEYVPDAEPHIVDGRIYIYGSHDTFNGIACNVYGRNGTQFMSMVKYRKGLNPFLTQKGGDREEGPDQYVSNFCTDCTVGFKYFDLRETRSITVNL